MSRQLSHFDLVTARLFVAVVESESIAAAAQQSGIAASALSKRIKLLEEEIGAPLLQRHRRGVGLTSVGMIVLRRARSMLHEARGLEADLSATREGLSGRVVVSANEATLAEFVPRILPRFYEAYPAVEIVLTERTNPAVVRAVWQNAADIGIYVGDVPPIELWHRPIYRDRLVLVAHRSHPLAACDTVSMEQILKHEVVGQATEGALMTLLARAAAAFNEYLTVRIFADGYDTVCKIVSYGLAIGVVSEGAAQFFAPQLGLLVIPIADAWALREHHVCVRALKNLAPAQRAVLDHLIEASNLTSL
ncbi:LysR family transcriptional regulator [Bradyrhizobium mercantei]|uniref:LysR family transcriptional regulator n=1 Tax=Bradyrhizobium mercantei TaxID=1904807 RepID=UPI000975F7FE|nr:LysR family transcriptional regulator [Bradyrhizobium mercantei]